MSKIAEALSKAIKEGRWLDIAYQHSYEETTYFWAAIVDIDVKNKVLICDIFNHNKSYDSINGARIKFDKIKSASPLFFTSYYVPPTLIDKLNSLDPDETSWLEYDKYNSNILNYYQECSLLDSDPFQRDYYLIEGIDLTALRKQKNYILSDNQQKSLIEKVYHSDDYASLNKELIITVFSISRGNDKYVICYYPLTYNPKEKSLVVSNRLLFNKSFLIKGKKNSLYKYIDTDVDEFIDKFKSHYEECKQEIISHLKPGEMADNRPDILLLARDIPVNLADTYTAIEKSYNNKELSKPLEAFFGNLTRKKVTRKEPALVIYDKKINIDQMRVLYNSMTQPVTYVQGPPGTGKTQTILNVVLCNFVADRTLLISSSNNTPVDGIAERLSFKYNHKDVMFPYLRLGRFEEVAKSTKKILELYVYEDNRKPDDSKINQILARNEKNNAILCRKLKEYEKRLELEELIESGNKLITTFNNRESGIIKKIKEKIKDNKDELSKMQIITDDDVMSLFTPISDDNRFLSYLYFQSLKYIKKLKTQKYQPLIDICKIDSDEERVKNFNNWIKDDGNMKLLIQAFPVILTTNISSARLGTTNAKFDLAIIDEAGQCNVAHALLPIARANNLLLVGDVNQLRPVIILEDSVNDELMEKFNINESYSYKDNSILSIMKNHDSVSKKILLSYHYRCGKKIINFSNKRYYNSELKTNKLSFDGKLSFVEIKTNNTPKNRNENIDECLGIINYIKKNNIKGATIITPFVNQETLMNKLLAEHKIEDVNCGTIHSLQGAEKDTIIFSTSISPRTSQETFKWLKNNEQLINVGVTRAKKQLIIASDYGALNKLSDKSDDLYALVKYVRSNGECYVAPSINSISIGKSNNSKAEDEFYKTISHFCSVYRFFEAERNVPFSKIFKDDPVLSKSKMEFDVVLYRKDISLSNVEIVIEINGGEHFGNLKRQKCDSIKRNICKQNKWRYLSIPNSFVKSYEEIREIILSTKGKKFEQLSLFDD